MAYEDEDHSAEEEVHSEQLEQVQDNSVSSMADTPDSSTQEAARTSLVDLEQSSGNGSDQDFLLHASTVFAPPELAHVQLHLGRVQTFFHPIPQEHDLTTYFSPQGMKLWDKYFAPHVNNTNKSGKICEIPVSWFNFITLMLMTPEKIDWVKGFLSSHLWEIIKEPLNKEVTIAFSVPDKCAVSEAPSCALISDACETQSECPEAGFTTPKRKRKEGKHPLVESEVRRSPRLVLLNDGYRNHANCHDKNCLYCHAAPPIINTKIVKNLAVSLCKVDEETLEKKLEKKSKTSGEINKATGPVKNMAQKGGKVVAGTTSGTSIRGKAATKTAEVDQAVKKKNK
jgi:hypothetical protein